MLLSITAAARTDRHAHARSPTLTVELHCFVETTVDLLVLVGWKASDGAGRRRVGGAVKGSVADAAPTQTVSSAVSRRLVCCVNAGSLALG